MATRAETTFSLPYVENNLEVLAEFLREEGWGQFSCEGWTLYRSPEGTFFLLTARTPLKEISDDYARRLLDTFDLD